MCSFSFVKLSLSNSFLTTLEAARKKRYAPSVAVPFFHKHCIMIGFFYVVCVRNSLRNIDYNSFPQNHAGECLNAFRLSSIHPDFVRKAGVRRILSIGLKDLTVDSSLTKEFLADVNEENLLS